MVFHQSFAKSNSAFLQEKEIRKVGFDRDINTIISSGKDECYFHNMSLCGIVGWKMYSETFTLAGST